MLYWRLFFHVIGLVEESKEGVLRAGQGEGGGGGGSPRTITLDLNACSTARD
jgi:hypothetical protein